MNEMNEPLPPAPMTPITFMGMIAQAASRGDLDTVRQLYEFKKEVEAHEARKAFDAAIAKASAELPSIVKDKRVDFTSQKGRTRYQYEDLDSVLSAVKPVLGKHGLSVRFKTTTEQGRITVTCRLAHEAGHFEENTLSGAPDDTGQKNAMQQMASTVTYLSRYTLKAALGLSAGVDDDAGAASRKSILSAEQQQQVQALVGELADPEAALEKILIFAHVATLAEMEDRYLPAVLKALRKWKQSESATEEQERNQNESDRS